MLWFKLTYILICFLMGHVLAVKVQTILDDFLADVDGFMTKTNDCVQTMIRKSASVPLDDGIPGIVTNRSLSARFSPQQLSLLCAKMDDWSQKADDEGLRRDASLMINRDQAQWLFGIRTCKDLHTCYCATNKNSSICKNDNDRDLGWLSGPQVDPFPRQSLPMSDPMKRRRKKRQLMLGDFQQRAIRKEYRRMTDEERLRFQVSLNKLKTELVDNKSKYDLLVMYHTPSESPGAHWGPAFLPWHRELLKQLEFAMRLNDPRVSLPYWDSTLDEGLPNPADSILWTDKFMGNGDGYVTIGPFKDWVTTHKVWDEYKITRSVGESTMGSLFRPDDLTELMRRAEYASLTSCVDPFFELLHGTVHVFVGGHMGEIGVSPDDPSFFMHHNFVDYLWDKFRREKQTKQQMVAEYPAEDLSCNKHHYKDALMLPFPFMKNIDGLSLSYTEDFYAYEERPICRGNPPTCGSDYLFCHDGKRCLSKVKLGGRCDGFEDTEICYGDRIKCVSQVCSFVSSARARTPGPTPTPPTTIVTTPPEIVINEITLSPVTENTTQQTSSTATVSKHMKAVPVDLNSDCDCMCYCPADVSPLDRWARNGVRATDSSTIAPDVNEVINSNSTDNEINETSTTMPSIESTTTSPRATASIDFPDNVWIPVTIIEGDVFDLPVVAAKDVNILSITLDEEGRVYSGVEISRGASSGELSYPYFEGAAAIQVPNPAKNGGSVESQTLVRNAKGDACQAYCYDLDEGYIPCSGKVVLNVDPSKSDQVAFTPFRNQVAYLSWRGKLMVPTHYLFACSDQRFNQGRKPVTKECQFIKFNKWMLIGLAEQVLTNVTIDECVKECRKFSPKPTAQNEEGKKANFECLSLVYWSDYKECVLNSRSRETNPELFAYFANDNTVYYEQVLISWFLGNWFRQSSEELELDNVFHEVAVVIICCLNLDMIWMMSRWFHRAIPFINGVHGPITYPVTISSCGVVAVFFGGV